MAVVATATSRRIVPLPTEYLPIEPAGEGFALDLRFPSEGASSGRDGSLHVGLHQCQIRRQEVEALLAVEEVVQPLGQRRADPGGLLDRVGALGGVSGGDADHRHLVVASAGPGRNRKSAVAGRSGSFSVDIGGGGFIKKQKKLN